MADPVIGGGSDAARLSYARAMMDKGGVSATLEPFVGGAQKHGWPAESGQRVHLYQGDTYLGSTSVGSAPKQLPPGSAGHLQVVAAALEKFAQGGGETARVLMDTAKRIGTKLPAVFNLAPMSVGLLADERESKDPAKVGAWVDRLASGDADARLQFESMVPTDPLRQAIQDGINKKALGAEDA